MVDPQHPDRHLHRRQFRPRLKRRPEGYGPDHAGADRHRAGHLCPQHGHRGDDITAVSTAARELEQELSIAPIVEVMTALKEEHVASTRVEQMMQDPKAMNLSGAGPSAAAIEPYATFDFYKPRSAVDQVIDPYPRADAVLATLDPLPLAQQRRGCARWQTSFHDLKLRNGGSVRTQLVELGASVRTLVHYFGDRMAEDRRKVLKASPENWLSRSNTCRSGW